MNGRRIYVFDLDLTFVKINTFHHWILFILKSYWYNPVIIFNFLKIFLKRALHIYDHSGLKKEILLIVTTHIKHLNIDRFLLFLEKNINKEVYDYFSGLKKEITILATAAPDIYAKPFAEILGFKYVTATSSNISNTWTENVRNEKCLSVHRIIQSDKEFSGIEIELITDHHDDLPLMHLAYLTRLVNPKESTLNIIKNAQVKYSLF